MFTKLSSGGKQKRPFYFCSTFLWQMQDKAYHVSWTVNEGLMLYKNSPIVPGRMRVKHNSFSNALSLVNKVSRQESADCLGIKKKTNRERKRKYSFCTQNLGTPLLHFRPEFTVLYQRLIGPTQFSKQHMTSIYLCCFSILPKIYNAGF